MVLLPRKKAMTRLFLCGDVMTGRGVDQALPDPCDPEIHEPVVRDARDYLVPVPADFWAAARPAWERFAPDVRIGNLETTITRRGEPWPGKSIHYRMSPENASRVLGVFDLLALANNHMLDWGYDGLFDTLDFVGRRGAGAGRTLDEAAAPARAGDVLFFSCGWRTSGIHSDWAAAPGRPGVWRTEEFAEMRERIDAARRPGDIVVVSIHWGPNQVDAIPSSEIRFARRLVDEAGVDVVHGHSSHHPVPYEVHRGRLILYGCGDFVNDYRAIDGRADPAMMYFADVEPGRLVSLEVVPVLLFAT